MNAAAIIATVATIASLAQQAIQVGKDAAPFIKLLVDSFKGKTEVTDEELAAIQAEVDRLSNELDAPLPPEEPAPGG